MSSMTRSSRGAEPGTIRSARAGPPPPLAMKSLNDGGSSVPGEPPGLFVAITLSVIIQVGSFKLTGKRVFRMAPLQHHFELLGWNEVTIVIRFWIIAGLFVALGLGLFYAEWVVGAT